MAFPLVAAAFYAVSTYSQMQGQAQADKDQASAADRNASFFREQAAFIERSGVRELSIFDRTAADIESAQVEAYARSAVEFSGSAVMFVAEQSQLASAERDAIRADTAHRKRLAILRAQDSQNEADNIRATSGQRQFATLLGGVGQIAGSIDGGDFASKARKPNAMDKSIATGESFGPPRRG